MNIFEPFFRDIIFSRIAKDFLWFLQYTFSTMSSFFLIFQEKFREKLKKSRIFHIKARGFWKINEKRISKGQTKMMK